MSDRDGWLPGWAPYVIFALLALFLFREFIVSAGMLFGTDTIALGYFARKLYADLVTGMGIFPDWDPFLFGGLPFVDAMHGDIFYPTTILKFFMPVHRALGWKLVIHVFLAGTFAYAWLRHLGLERAIATFGGVAYMLAPVLISLVYPGHDGKLFVTALTPLAFWVTDWAVIRGGTWRFAVLACVVALLIFTAHLQLAYFATWGLVVLVVFRLVQAWRRGEGAVFVARRFGAFAAAGIVGALLIGAIQVWAPLRYLTTYSQRVEKTIGAEAERGYDYATTWSLHPEEAFSLLVPEFIGFSPGGIPGGPETYWGRNPFKLNHEYAGLIPLILLPLAFLDRRRRAEAWLFTGLAAASLIYALGATTPLFYLFYWLVPGVKLFRAPSSIAFVFAIAVVTAGSIGLQAVTDRAREGGRAEADHANRRATLYLWAVPAIFLLLAVLASAGVFTELWTAILYRDMPANKAAALQANLANIQQGLWLTALIGAALAGAWQLRVRGSLPSAAWIAVVIGLAVLDPLRVNAKFIQVVNPNVFFPRDDTTEFLIARDREAGPFRVFPLGGYQPNHFAFYGLEELAGHHGNELGRYVDLIDQRRLGAQNLRVMKLLTVRYLVSPRPLQAAPGLRAVHQGGRSVVYELEGAFPRAFLVNAVEVVPDSLALDRLTSPGFDPRRTAIVDPESASRVGLVSGPLAEAAREEDGTIRWLERGINQQRLEVESPGSALLIISENHYPAWQATIDGQPSPLFRANYTLRGLKIPPGRHEVVIYYQSRLFRISVWTTLLSLFAVVGVVGTSRLRSRRERT